MKTKEWASVTEPNTLLIGESSMLQWSDQIIDYVMFLDYYFRPKPYDLGERSRYAEAKNIFEMMQTLTGGECRPQNLYATNLTYDMIPRPPKGKRLLITSEQAKKGIKDIEKILRDNPTITTVFAMDMQTNYYLQLLGFCQADPEYLRGAEPRRIGINEGYYQPVDGKVFRKICCKKFNINCNNSTLIPILHPKEYPLRGENVEIYRELYENLSK